MSGNHTMPETLSQEELEQIDEQLAEYAAGYSGFLSWACRDILEEDSQTGPGEPWRAAFLVFSGKGRVEVYQDILSQHGFPADPFTIEFLKRTSQELDEWLTQSWNEVARLFEDAFPFILKSYHDSYLRGGETGLVWDFDDFLDERDILEFFIIGAGDLLPVKEFSEQLAQHDHLIRQEVAQLGLEEFGAEFFPGRIAWYPARFWWHHFIPERPTQAS